MSETAVDYHPMWDKLGLNLEKHDALLGFLGEVYTQLYLNRTGRPKGMGYFDFVMSEVHGLRVKELQDARDQGRIVVGSFCLYVPEELILAVDGVSIGLCAGAEFGTESAEQYLPRNTCALIKSFFGFALERVCPYLASCDLVVGENTCDGKKKAFEIFGDMVKHFHVLDMPQMKSPMGKQLLRAEYTKLATELEAVSGKKITYESLQKGIAIVNEKRKALHRLQKLRGAVNAPIAGLDALLISQVYFYDDPVRFTGSVNALCDELEQRVAKGEGMPEETPRILVSGCPMAVPNWKIHAVVEGSGAVIVGEESCIGERGTRNLTDSNGRTVNDLLDAITERYFSIDCAIFTPNHSRREHIRELAKTYHADGVLHYALQFCTPYQMEAGMIERELEAERIPVLRIETDYSQEDTGQLRNRVEAFIERIRN